MTFEQLDRELPNGFHDAKLGSLKVDYLSQSATLLMALDFGSPEGSKEIEYRLGEVQVSGLYFCAIDPPDPERRYDRKDRAMVVSGDTAQPDTFPALEQLSRTLPEGVSCFRFFVRDWNSFINIAAREVQIVWIDGKPPDAFH